MFIAGLVLNLSAIVRIKLTPQQPERRNYLEVAECSSGPNDSLRPDKYAMYPGRIDGINKFVGRNLKYPQKAFEKKIQGTVVLHFFVDADGCITDLKLKFQYL
jgi:outer membrane biosynthesis protein TonB